MRLNNALVAFALCTVFLGAFSLPPARAATIERVVAVVNDQPILLSEVRRRAAPVIERLFTAETDETNREKEMEKVYSEVLDRLIDELLISQTARRMLVTVTQKEENQAVETVRTQSGLSEADFWTAVKEQGFSETEYRADIRKQLLRMKVMNQRVRGRVNINEEDVKLRYEDSVREAKRKERFSVSHIYLAIPEPKTAQQIAQTRDLAFRLKKIVTKENFEQTAHEYGGGDLGWIKQGDLPPDIEKSLLSLQTGQIGEPVQGVSGFHIFWLRDRQKGSEGIPTYEETKEKIYRSLLDETMMKQEKIFVQELRREAVIQKRM